MRLKALYGFVFVVLLLVSCNKAGAPDCFKRAGATQTVTRTLTPFDILVLDANIEVVLEIGPEYKAEITGGANLLDKITTSVESGSLTIDNSNQCNFVRGYDHKITMRVYCPKYKYVVTNSIGNIITAQNFVQDTISVRSEAGDITLYGNYNQISTSSHGNGNVYFKGTTNRLFTYMNGTNYLYANEGTITGYVFIENISLASAYINAPNGGTLDYHIWKSGNIYYKGNPANVSGKIDGTGKLIKE
ncbi:MAG: GIN domain-containing protein [Sphingobacteriaceae bacterium]|jgi:hypothetical protein